VVGEAALEPCGELAPGRIYLTSRVQVRPAPGDRRGAAGRGRPPQAAARRAGLEPRVYIPKQLGQLLASARPGDRAVLLVLAGTGLRAGELCGLRSARVDLGRRRLEVATVRYDAGRFGRGYKPRPKSTAGIRSIPLADPVVEELRRRAARRNGPRSCSPTHPATASGTPTCVRSARRGITATCSAWTCAAPMTSGTPSQPGWRTTASPHG
jgi:integrase